VIIFDLDGTLADCEHRRHFVDASKIPILMIGEEYNPEDLWKPDWQSFYEACDQDKPIEPVCDMYAHYFCNGNVVEIWSGRCESTREKTIEWIFDNILTWIDTEDQEERSEDIVLRMRPIGDNTPDDELKERWLNEVYELKKHLRVPLIDFVFDDRPKVIRMWRRRGIFVFNCCQHDEEF
jgi:FMN phosphatase YigB (HAD superfamily)